MYFLTKKKSSAILLGKHALKTFYRIEYLADFQASHNPSQRKHATKAQYATTDIESFTINSRQNKFHYWRRRQTPPKSMRLSS